jgi:hypothetical protein
MNPKAILIALVERATKLPDMAPGKRHSGLDLQRRYDTRCAWIGWGRKNTYRYDPALDLGVKDRCAGLETFQDVLTALLYRRSFAKHGFCGSSDRSTHT